MIEISADRFECLIREETVFEQVCVILRDKLRRFGKLEYCEIEMICMMLGIQPGDDD